MENLQSMALAAGLAWASGIRMYAAISAARHVAAVIAALGFCHRNG